MAESTRGPLKLFYCYAYEDKALRDKIDEHLSVLKRHRLIEIWYDGKISAGMERQPEIDEHLKAADIILLLVSAAFLASDYCYEKEMKEALQRHTTGIARVIPIILRPVDWKDAPFSSLQVLPTGGLPVTKWADPEEAYADIARNLRGVVKQLQISQEVAQEQYQHSIILPVVPAKLPGARHNLPSQYGVFLGRDRDVERVLEGLAEPWPLISIVGMGGMGKTRLAIEIAHLCLTEGGGPVNPPFKYAVWVSAKDRLEQQLWLNDVLDTIARVLGDFSLITLPMEQLEQKKREVDELLRTNQTLLIIDNFETIKDAALEFWLERVPNPSKVLITSRFNRFWTTWNTDLKDLDDTTALQLIKKHAQRLGLNSLKAARQDLLQPLVDVTKGNPKAIEIASGLIKRGKGLKEVIEIFRAAGPGVNNTLDEVFMWSWQIMTDHGKCLLMVATFFADSMSKEALGATAELTADELCMALEELVEFMLLEVKEGEATASSRYGIHPLTRAFATKQLRQRAAFAEHAREHWSDYYLRFVADSLERDISIEHYLNALKTYDLAPVDQEWPNLSNVLAWAEQAAQTQKFVDLMMLLTHYMDRRMFFQERINNTRKVAEVAHKAGMDEYAALFYIDGLSWTFIQEDRLEEAEQAIALGLLPAQSITPRNSRASDLMALANTYLARIQLERDNLPRALEFINKSLALVQSSTYLIRVNKMAGDIARKQEQYAQALEFYTKARHAFLQQGEVGDMEARELNYRFGLTYLAIGDNAQAESSFKAILEHAPVTTTVGTVYTNFGLAQVAKARGDWEKARYLASYAREALTYKTTAHRLLKHIDNFLLSLAQL
ncbi:MAG TPA: NB-ARC domain-containing protein [Ktedonobacteraceae bacterium]